MEVHELIAKLQKCDPHATVIRTSSNFELNGASVKASGVHESKTGEKRQTNCRDAFDGTEYTTETWSTFGGEESIISIS